MNIAILGYGKMGKTIEQLALQRGHTIALKVNSTNYLNVTEKDFKNIDVAIEFTSPVAVLNNIKTCFSFGVPIVVGTTGWLDKLDEITELCNQQNQSLLYASNFSVGVNIFFELNKKLAQLMNNRSEYKLTIHETHHTQKLDSPSGTAISLANDIIKNCDEKTKWVSHASEKNEELPIISERIDDVPGTHTINYSSEIDSIEITHTAHNRKGFALGAVIAAEWLVSKKGVFTMQDVLK